MTLERRTPLARGAGPKADPVKVREWTARSRKRLPARSAKRVEEAPLRALVVATALARDGGCVGYDRGVPHACEAPVGLVPPGPTDCHEVIPRSAWPGGHLVLTNTATVCRPLHDWIDAHPDDAHAVGLHGYSWER